ncbi:MAG: ribosome-associated translation inhibitor RaiA [Armatimonadota bacterium]
MIVKVKGKHIEVTPALREYAEKKLSKLSKYFGEIKEARVVESVQRNQHIIEVMLEGDGILLRCEERSDDMYAAVDVVLEKLEQRVRKFKGKLYDRSHHIGPRDKEARRDQVRVENEAQDGAEGDEEYEPNIARVKRFPAKPMSPEEAARQMELLHHDFFVFVNSDTQQVSVVYRRKSGDYGLLEPEF